MEQEANRSQSAETTRLDAGAVFTCQPGDLLCERFRVVRFIARGGMGELYEAEDLELHERVALKTIRQEVAADERMHQRFRREVQLARKVTHQNICRIFDLFQHQPDAGAPAVVFVTMELLEGETLAQRLKRDGRLSSRDASPLVAQMAAALSAAHAAGVVHRDFKSNNVMLLPARLAGEPPRAVVTDFGLAYSLTAAGVAGESISVPGEIVGTPDYMAPEQIAGGAVTPAADIFALGVVLYETVTGVRPFAADTPMASALRRISGPPPRAARDLAPELPPEWNTAIMRCLSRRPEDRYPDLASLTAALDPGVDQPRRRSWQMAAAVLLGVVSLALVAGQLAWRRATRASNPRVPTTTTAVPSRQAVAVLGFRNLAGREDLQWLSTALAEMLTTELAASETLRTVPGENIDRMKVNLALRGAESYGAETLARIRQNLGTDLIVLGSFVAVGEGPDATLRVDIRLQDARSGQSVSAASETGSAAELLDLVSRAGRHVREHLGADQLAPAAAASVRASQPASPDAARLYAEGLTSLRRFDALAARERLDGAIQADPRFPLAHSALASTWATLGYDERALQASKRAFELSANLPREERLVVEGTYRQMAKAWKEAIGIWQTLSTFFPDDIEYALRLANAQIESGDVKDGIGTIERFRARFPQVKDPRLEIAEANAASTLSDFKRAEASAAAAAAAADAEGATLLVAAARLLQGAAVLNQGRQSEATALFEEARRLYTTAGDRAGAARSINDLATSILDADPRRAMALYEEGLATARAVGEQSLVARLLNNLAIQDRRAGNLQASLERNQESLAIRREIGDRTNTAISLNNIGNVLLDLADPKGAVQHYEESAAMSREIGDRRGLARALHNDAEALVQQGNLARARIVEEEALSIRRGIDDPASVATSLTGLAQVAAAQGDLPTAKRLLGEGMAIDRRLDRRRAIAYDLHRLGDIAFVEGQLADARQRHEEALAIRTQLGEKGTAAESRVALAALALEEARFADAEALTREAAAVFEGQKGSDNEAIARATLAQALHAQGRSSPALREIAGARALVQHTQNVHARLQVLVAAARLDAATGNRPAATRSLESVRTEAASLGILRHELDARRALVETLPSGSSEAAAQMTTLRRDAGARGFGLYAAPRRLAN